MKKYKNFETDSNAVERNDPVAAAMLDLLANTRQGPTVAPEFSARYYAKSQKRISKSSDLWQKKYQRALCKQAIYVARAGHIEIMRKERP